MGAELLRIWFEKVDEFIKIYDGIRDLELFALERYNGVYDKRQVKMVVSSTTNNFEKIRVNLCKSLPIEKNIDF